MKQIVRRPELNDADIIALAWIGKALLLRQWVKNHPAHTFLLALGFISFFVSLKIKALDVWGIITASVSMMFVLDWIAGKVHSKRRAHWVAPTRPRDTGPL